MRIFFFPPLLLLAACGNSGAAEDEAPLQSALEPGLWTGGARDGLCVAENGAAAFIQYGDGEANCMAQGRIEGDSEMLTFVPRGDEQCSIPLLREGEVITLGEAPESCAYYCGGGASLKGEGLRRSDASPSDLVDVAGDPLC